MSGHEDEMRKALSYLLPGSEEGRVNNGRTHWLGPGVFGCYTEPGHHECAIARVAELEAELASANRECDIRNERELGYLARAQTAEARVAELEEAMRYAPHSHWCCMHGNGTSVLTDEFCNCWKRNALKGGK